MSNGLSTRLTTRALSVLGAMLFSLPAAASEPVDPPAFPELAPEAQLPAILAELRHTLADIYSVREVRICPASHIKMNEGRPTGWTVQFEYNSRTASGGFSGIQRDAAIFRNGRIAYPIGDTRQFGRTGFDGVFARVMDRQMEACTAIPDAAVQQALGAH